MVVDMAQFETGNVLVFLFIVGSLVFKHANECYLLGSQSVLTYATSHGLICGLDLRSSKLAWKLENDPSHGNFYV